MEDLKTMMVDRDTEIKLGCICPDFAERWKWVRDQMWQIHGRQIRITEGLRTFAQQWDVWNQGRLKDKDGSWVICDMKKVVTYAKPGESYHQYGLAVDSCFSGGDPYLMKIARSDAQTLWNQFGLLCGNKGLTWGGSFKHPDQPHCEITYGLSIHSIQIIYEDKGIKGVWEKCSQLSTCGRELV